MSSESIHNTIILTIITLVAGLLLGFVYDITKNPIADEKQRAKEEAYKEVYHDAESFSAVKVDNDSIADELEKNGIDATIDECMEVKDSGGKVIGHVLKVTDHEGYGGDITFAMGVSNEGQVYGISFLSIGETAGLGMKAKEDKFKSQFAGKTVTRFSYTKSGSSTDSEIDAISGATITTNAVTNGVNAGLIYLESLK